MSRARDRALTPRHALIALALFVIAGCASILDIPTLQPPPPGFAEAGADGGREAACAATGVSNLVLTPRGVHTAVDDTDVYFTRGDPPRGSAVLRCAKCGCDMPTLLAKTSQPGGIAVDDKFVFWTDSVDNGSLNRLEKANPTNVQTLAGQETPIGVTVDAEFVYWTVIGGVQGIDKAGIYRARKTDLGAVTKLTSSADLPDNIVPYAIGVDDTHVYYTTTPDLNDQDAQQPCNDSFGTVRRVLKTGGLQPSQVVASKQGCPVGLALDEGNVYWANLGAGKALGGSVAMTKKSGGTPVKLADGLGRPTSLVLRKGRLAWNVPANQRVEGCTLPTCTDVATIADSQRNPSGLSADDSGVYWAVLGTVNENFTDGALRRFSGP